MRGLLVDPITNSLNLSCKNCMGGSKENYKWDLRSERVKIFDALLQLVLFKTIHLQVKEITVIQPLDGSSSTILRSTCKLYKSLNCNFYEIFYEKKGTMIQKLGIFLMQYW